MKTGDIQDSLTPASVRDHASKTKVENRIEEEDSRHQPLASTPAHMHVNMPA